MSRITGQSHDDESGARAQSAAAPAAAPGKRTLTMGLPSRHGSAGPVQRKRQPGTDTGRTQQAASTARWMDTAMRPDLHPAPVQAKMNDGHDLASHRFRGDSDLEKGYDNESAFTEGASGDHVKRIQQSLIDAGYPIASGATGTFGADTTAAVNKFQTEHGLGVDGVVGTETMTALDRYLRMDRGAAPLPPKAGSTEAKLEDILAKGDKMTAAEATEAKKLLFSMSNDDFRLALKTMRENGTMMHVLAKLDIGQILDAATELRHEVVIPVTRLKPAKDTIDADFKRANEIFNPHLIEIEKGPEMTISERTTKKILGGDTDLDEFTRASATAEEMELMKRNRQQGRITGYWVPTMTSSRGEGLVKSDLGNMLDDRQSVVVNADSRAQDTFAHEVGHLLGLDHFDSTHDATKASTKNNLMTSGDNRNIAGAGIDQLTDDQLVTIRSSVFLEIGKKGVGK